MTDINSENIEQEDEKKHSAIRIRLENELAISINEYHILQTEIFESLKKCNLQLSKSMMLMKSTERDEFKVSLNDLSRGAYHSVLIKDEQSEALELVQNETIKFNKDEKYKLIVDDPLKLIRGGFTSLSLKEASSDFKLVLPPLIKLINLRSKIIKSINDLE